MQPNPAVSIIIVTWNNEKDILPCLKSLKDQDYTDINIIVVDNASSDNTVKVIRENFENIEILQQDKNLFLTGANNIGIEYAINHHKADYVVVLNPDTYAADNLISELLNSFSDDDVGAAGPIVKFWKNKNEGLINSAGIYFDGFMQAYDIGYMQKDEGQYNQRKEVFGVTGACIMYKTQMLNEIGLYDNRIKMYLDEVELFIRAKKMGWKVIFNPNTVIGHNYMQSTNKNSSFNRQKQVSKAWLIIALKHYPFKSKLAMIQKYIKSNYL